MDEKKRKYNRRREARWIRPTQPSRPFTWWDCEYAFVAWLVDRSYTSAADASKISIGMVRSIALEGHKPSGFPPFEQYLAGLTEDEVEKYERMNQSYNFGHWEKSDVGERMRRLDNAVDHAEAVVATHVTDTTENLAVLGGRINWLLADGTSKLAESVDMMADQVRDIAKLTSDALGTKLRQVAALSDAERREMFEGMPLTDVVGLVERSSAVLQRVAGAISTLGAASREASGLAGHTVGLAGRGMDLTFLSDDEIDLMIESEQIPPGVDEERLYAAFTGGQSVLREGPIPKGYGTRNAKVR